MAASQYISAVNQSPVDKITNLATPNLGVAQQVNTVAVNLTQKMLGAGASIGAISSSVTTGLDNISSNLRGETTSLTQAMMTRQSPEDLIRNRKSAVDNVEAFSNSHMPSKKVADVKAADARAGVMQYPPDLRKYYISFAFGEYKRPNSYAPSTFNADLWVALPMPSNLLDPSGVKLKPTELGGLLGQGLENVAAVMQDISSGRALDEKYIKNFGEAARRGGNAIVGTGYNAVYEAVSIVPGLDDVMGTVGQLAGAVPNPHVTVFFQGVDLRSHTFTWRFAPKNATESQSIQNIIKEFKKRTLPNYKWGEANVLGYPQMVEISLEPDMSEQLYKFKKCMVSSVNVNYAPNGIPSFFAGTKFPTSIEFQVSLQELEILTSQDYGGENASFFNGSVVGNPGNGTARTPAEIAENTNIMGDVQ